MKISRMMAVVTVVVLGTRMSHTLPAVANGRQQSGAQAKPTAATPPAAEPAYRPGIGTIIVADLSRSLNARKAKAGDPAEARVTQDLVYKGKIIVPRNSKVEGHVTVAKRYDPDNRESLLGVVFDKFILRHDKELPFQAQAVIVALAPPPSEVTAATQRLQDLPIQMERGRSTGGAAIDTIQQQDASVLGPTAISTTGVLSGENRGVIGLKGLTLHPSGPQGCVVASSKGDVKLEAGNQIVLEVAGSVK